MADNFGFNVLTTSDNVDITKIDENFKKIDEKLAINNKIEPTSSLPASQAAVAAYVEGSADKILYTGNTDEIGSSVQSALDYLVNKTSKAAPTTAEDISYQSTYKEEVTNVKEALDNLENEFIGQSFTIADVQNQASSNTLSIEGINEKLSTIQVEGKYELIETIEVTEAISSIDRTQESDGTAYNFKDIFVVIKWTAASSSYNLIVEPFWDGTASANKLRVFRTIGTPVANSTSLVKIKSDGNLKQIYISMFNTNVGFVSANDDLMTCNAYKITDKNIVKLVLSTTNASGFPVGTKFEIWGVRA